MVLPPAPAQGQLALTPETLTPYLLERALVNPSSVVDPEYQVHDLTRRNRNFRVHVPAGRSLLVKQAGRPGDREFQLTLAAEAAFLESVAHDPRLTALRGITPEFADYDARAHVLTTYLIHPATALTNYHLNHGRPHFPREAGASCGRVLSTFHWHGTRAIERGILPSRTRYPFIWENFRTIDSPLADRNPADRELLKLLENGPYWRRLPEMRRAWNDARDFVHLDVRWDNFLLTHGAGPRGDLNLRLIDHELGGIGDSAWDVASYLTEYLRLWLGSTRSVIGASLSQLIESQRIPFTEFHPGAHGFWDAYCASARIRGSAKRKFRERVAGYLPFTLTLLAHEMLQGSSSMTAPSYAALKLADYAATDAELALLSWFHIEANS